MSDHHNQRAKEIIESVIYITIASVTDDGKPWNSPVFSAYDGDYNFYWGSHSNSQHSQNVRYNNEVFLVIYDSTVPAGSGEGVYMQATVRELSEPDEIVHAHALLRQRRPNPYWEIDEVSGDAPIRLYKATPTKIWMNDDGNVDGHYVDIRTEVYL